MAVTISHAAAHVLRMIEGRNRNPIERLSGAITTGDTTITMEFGDRNVHNGTYLEIERELVYLYDSATGGVLRGQQNTVAAEHADASIIKIEPRVLLQHVIDAMEHCIHDLPDTIFTTTTVDVAMTANKSWAELTGATGLEVLWAVGERDPHPSATGPYLRPPLNVIRNDAVTSGWIVQIEHAASYTEGQTIEVTYGHRFDMTTWSPGLDLIADIGVPEAFIPTIEFGTIARVLLGEETARNTVQTQAMPRRSEEVPPGVMMEVAREWQRQFDAGVARHASRLRREYPIIETS